MTILFDIECRDELGKALKEAHNSIYIMSAFVKTHALEWLRHHIAGSSNIQVTVVARWKPQDLMAAASDLVAYEYARDQGWTFAINSNMHFKVYMIDNERLFLGSSNFTQKGLHIDLHGNDEANLIITPSLIDISRLKKYVDGCCLINDDLYQEMKRFIEQQEQGNSKQLTKWPDYVQQQLQVDIKKLRVNDLLFNSPEDLKQATGNLKMHDFLLLGLKSDKDLDNLDLLSEQIKKLSLWNWLINTVCESGNEFVKFGEISAKLHVALPDDPKITRKDVKIFVANIYEWIRYVKPLEIGLKKINVTEAIFLRDIK